MRLLLTILAAVALMRALPGQTACDPAAPSAVNGASVVLTETVSGVVVNLVPASNVVVLLRAPNTTSPIPYGDGFLCLSVGAGIERVAVAVAPQSGSIDFGAQPPGWYQLHYRDCPRGDTCSRFNLSNARRIL